LTRNSEVDVAHDTFVKLIDANVTPKRALKLSGERRLPRTRQSRRSPSWASSLLDAVLRLEGRFLEIDLLLAQLVVHTRCDLHRHVAPLGEGLSPSVSPGPAERVGKVVQSTTTFDRGSLGRLIKRDIDFAKSKTKQTA